MKLATFIAAATLGISSGAFAADDHKGHEHEGKGAAAHKDEAKPAHGGIVTVAKDVSYELVARPDLISLYVSDHGKPVDLAGATAKVTLLSAGKKEEAALVPAADSLQAKGTFAVGAGTKVVANVSLKGQAPQPIRFSLK
ncbi:hypothetical protein NU688_19795 [Variovorax sp. ZS18.2.2]|uniref:hypothetical protein n=1 Tax=Variovorax sp. ZS18.2.2 TaxID=2971255 RepID=UPI002150CF00|nr:hypothetical protein [Variovorax sp. ZS18.2.2]MCR6478414.1 hypothetical protein [Variovorax sp. ZS18.2.2]